MIDGQHSNPVQVYQKMGSPTWPDEAQMQALLAASELVSTTVPVTLAGGAASVTLTLQQNSAALILFEE